MKHLLIILISILLLSSPVIGDNHKGETLYRWGTIPFSVWKGFGDKKWGTSSLDVWKGFGDKETQPVYKGEVENGVPNGLGILIYPNGVKYVGSWKDGGWLNGTEYLKGGRIFNGIIYNKDRKIIWKVVNGKYIKP